MATFGVATKGVVVNEENRFLVIRKSSKEDINPLTYDIPGGRVEFGEELMTALIREVKEETGLDVEPIQVFNAWTYVKDDFHLTGVDYICKLRSGTETLSEEHDGILWVSLEEAQVNKEFPGWLVKTLEKADKLLAVS